MKGTPVTDTPSTEATESFPIEEAIDAAAQAAKNAPVTDATLTSMKEGLDSRAKTINERINVLTLEREKVNRTLAAQRAQIAADADKRRREINAEVSTLREELATIDRVRSGFTPRTRTTKKP